MIKNGAYGRTDGRTDEQTNTHRFWIGPYTISPSGKKSTSKLKSHDLSSGKRIGLQVILKRMFFGQKHCNFDPLVFIFGPEQLFRVVEELYDAEHDISNISIRNLA